MTVACLSASSYTHHRSCRHCSVALKGLKPAFAAISKHTAKALQKIMARYPTPKEKVAHQNYRGMKQSYFIDTTFVCTKHCSPRLTFFVAGLKLMLDPAGLKAACEPTAPVCVCVRGVV